MYTCHNGDQTTLAPVEDGKNISMLLSPRDQASVSPVRFCFQSTVPRDSVEGGGDSRGWGPGYTRHASGCLALLNIVLGMLHRCKSLPLNIQEQEPA